LQFNAAAFYFDYRDKQVRGRLPDPILGALNRTINIAKSRIHGGEVSLVYTPSDRFRMNVGVSYLESEILEAVGTSNALARPANVVGEVLPLTPQWQVQGDAEYNIPLANESRLYFGGHLQFQDSTFSGFGQLELFETPSYTNFDLRAGWRAADEKLTLGVFVDNVTDTYSWNFVNAQGPDIVTRLTNPPRTFGARLSYRY